MRKEIKLEDCIGKTLENFAFSGTFNSEQMVLTFTDGTFTTIEATVSYDCPELAECKLKLFEFDRDELEKVGIATVEEVKTLRDEQNRVADLKRQLQNEANERATFERLKKKFGE
ncbi:MAG: hypothetical protein V4493_01080 [Pseudomonadota bacterium]